MIIDVFVVSTSRFKKYGAAPTPSDAKDVSGNVILEHITSKGRQSTYRLLPDEIDAIRNAVSKSTGDAIVICGGTGLSPLDLTIEAVEPLLEKKMPGFGEIFRLRSLEEVGTKAILSRALAGIANDVPIFCLPGSPSAARLGIDIILMEIEHMLKHIKER